ncbi:MAG: OmpA family protein [Bdellovibrionales bacterium]|nr:OmpA family protein [Bdellovibrionales bacterium]
MSRIFALVFVALTLVFGVSCSSKQKKEETTTTDVGADPSISGQAMSFDPMGSDSGKINGLETVNFDYDQATLTAAARKTLAGNANWIKTNSGMTIQVEGHCDARGSIEYNLSLGERRAKAVKNYLVSLGIDAKRMTIISYGKEKLLAQGDSEGDHARNRRANFVPLPQ